MSLILAKHPAPWVAVTSEQGSVDYVIDCNGDHVIDGPFTISKEAWQLVRFAPEMLEVLHLLAHEDRYGGRSISMTEWDRTWVDRACSLIGKIEGRNG